MYAIRSYYEMRCMSKKNIKNSHKKQVTETGAIRKNWADRIRVALVYPNIYSVGMSNLGFQTVYRLLNDMDHVVCERAFLPEKAQAVRSVESGRLLTDFDIVAFSISFESDFFNLLTRITSYNVCYTKLLRVQNGDAVEFGQPLFRYQP